MADIEVKRSERSEGDAAFRVEVRDGPVRTTHDVTVPAGLPGRIGWEGEDEGLVKASFEFLVERESATSILRRFSLDVIGKYFPDYFSVMGRRPRDRGT